MVHCPSVVKREKKKKKRKEWRTESESGRERRRNVKFDWKINGDAVEKILSIHDGRGSIRFFTLEQLHGTTFAIITLCPPLITQTPLPNRNLFAATPENYSVIDIGLDKWAEARSLPPLLLRAFRIIKTQSRRKFVEWFNKEQSPKWFDKGKIAKVRVWKRESGLSMIRRICNFRWRKERIDLLAKIRRRRRKTVAFRYFCSGGCSSPPPLWPVRQINGCTAPLPIINL